MITHKPDKWMLSILLILTAMISLFSTASLSAPAPNSPSCKATFSIIDIKYVGKLTPTTQSSSGKSILCAGKTIPARYLINTRITKSWDPETATRANVADQCDRLYSAGKEIELTLTLPTRGPANQFQDRTIVEGMIKMGGYECDHGVFLTDYRIPSREERARLTSSKQSLTSIPVPGKLLSSSSFKTCKKSPIPPCPGGRLIRGAQGSDGCFGPSICTYPKLPGSCENRCSWTSGSGRCSCDIECTKRGDCCTDYVYLCTPRKCPDVKDPVCSASGVTYSNTCQAELSFAKIACKGACPCKQNCPAYKEPACLEGKIEQGPAGRNGCPGPYLCRISTQSIHSFEPKLIK